jgi:hypothetical protein
MSALRRFGHPARAGIAAAVAVALGMAAGGCADGKPVAGSSARVGDGAWGTWVLRSPGTIQVPAPPPGSRGTNGDLVAAPMNKTLLADWGETPAVARWIEVSLALVSGRKVTDPPRASRTYALVSVAMYDAAVAASYWQRRYAAADGEPGRYPSQRAAVAGAASYVLAYLFPERPAASLDRLAERATRASVLSGERPSAVQAGLALGRAIGRAVVARARADGSTRKWNGHEPPHGRQFWSPAPGTNAEPVEVLAGTWKPWVLRSGAQFRPPPPPAYGSPAFISEARELIRLRSRLTPEQKRVAKFWEGNVGSPLPPGVWNAVALAYVRRDRLDTLHAARVFALLNVAMSDTGIAAWDAKYAYWSARPENAIRDLGLDRTWTPFLATPPFPAYVSAHSAYSAAASEVLAYVFPRDAGAFRAKAEEAGVSRLWGGIHYRSDHTAGLELGRKVATLVLLRAARTHR